MFTIRRTMRKIRLGFRFLHMRLGKLGRKRLWEYLVYRQQCQALVPLSQVYSIPRTMIHTILIMKNCFVGPPLPL